MGMVMVKCPQTGQAIPTGIETDRESFARSAVFFARTRCPLCRADHAWFAREAWVDEPSRLGRDGAGHEDPSAVDEDARLLSARGESAPDQLDVEAPASSRVPRS